jgi:hypothetical protein
MIAMFREPQELIGRAAQQFDDVVYVGLTYRGAGSIEL